MLHPPVNAIVWIVFNKDAIGETLNCLRNDRGLDSLIIRTKNFG